jgi:hypothetical protein
MINIQEPRVKTVTGWVQALKDEPKINAAVIEHFINGLQYPANKKEIIKQAEGNWAPENVMAFYVNRLPERTYYHPSEISFTAFASAYFFGQD